MSKSNIDNAEFVMAWQQAETAKEVAEKFGVKANVASQRAFRLRSAGVKLKNMKKLNPIDVDALNKLIESK